MFLFGGSRIYRNMFNDNKYVECYLLSDLEKELGLNRGKLVRLAYLLGGDYADGLPGVGPVLGCELLEEFSGDDGLQRFKEWWTKVQSGRDNEEDTKTAWRRKFVRLASFFRYPEETETPACAEERPQEPLHRLELAEPCHRELSLLMFFGHHFAYASSTSQAQAYYKPAVNKEDEPFSWSGPDLDGLRTCVLLLIPTPLANEFCSKLPQYDSHLEQLKDGRTHAPSHQAAEPAQGRPTAPAAESHQLVRPLSPFASSSFSPCLECSFDVSAGNGPLAPREQRVGYASSRLQNVVQVRPPHPHQRDTADPLLPVLAQEAEVWRRS